MNIQRFRGRALCIGFICSIGVLGGCSIKQTVTPVVLTGQPAKVCIIRNEKVREGFIEAYIEALKARNIQARTLGGGVSLNECELASTYNAFWAWDLALYMRYAEIKVYRAAALVGEAVYDATWGGGRPDKFINAENKIRELVNELFPSDQARTSLTPE